MIYFIFPKLKMISLKIDRPIIKKSDIPLLFKLLDSDYNLVQVYNTDLTC